LRKITKTTEPTTLTEYRSTISANNKLDGNIYDDFEHKSREDCDNNIRGNLRRQLLEEQGYICCYCMSRISCKNSRIEHYKSQEHNRDRQIDYQNLFVACNGNEGARKKLEHCDVYKKDKELNNINLLTDIQFKIKYRRADGTIFSDDGNINDEINNILNLNLEQLRNARKESILVFYRKLKEKLGNKNSWKTKDLQKIVEHYGAKNEHGKYKVFCEMFIYFLNKHIQGRTA
jgi:uncharacterized protein (TIGR02646 family)